MFEAHRAVSGFVGIEGKLNFGWADAPGHPENPAFVNREVIFIILPEREADLDALQSLYPDGELTSHYYRENEVLFWMYIVDVPLEEDA